MEIQLEDQNLSLSLYHYKKCDLDSDPLVKSERGKIYNNNNEVVCSSFGYTHEYTLDDHNLYHPLLEPFDKCTFYKSEEGTLLRLFFENNKWILSTFKRINAFESYWSSSKSFGELFLEALQFYFTEGDGKHKLNTEHTNDIFDNFCNTLDTKYVYTFLLKTNKDTRMLCTPSPHPTLFFTGIFSNGEYVEGNPTLLSLTPELLTFNTKEEVDDYVNNVDYLKSQGVLVFLPNKTYIKIINPLYLMYKKIRGTEPNIEMAYCRIRKSDDDTIKMFHQLFPEFDSFLFENKLNKVVNYLHNTYINRYIKKNYMFVEPIFNNLLKKAHSWHVLDRKTNIVTYLHIKHIIEEQTSLFIYKLFNEFYKVNSF